MLIIRIAGFPAEWDRLTTATVYVNTRQIVDSTQSSESHENVASVVHGAPGSAWPLSVLILTEVTIMMLAKCQFVRWFVGCK